MILFFLFNIISDNQSLQPPEILAEQGCKTQHNNYALQIANFFTAVPVDIKEKQIAQHILVCQTSPSKNKNASSGHKTKQAGLTALSAWQLCKPICLDGLSALFCATTSAWFSSVFFWHQTLTVLTRQTRQAICSIKQSQMSMALPNGIVPNAICRVWMFL